MRLLNLKQDSVVSLQAELLRKLREQFDLLMQLKSGQWKKVHMLRAVSRDIASIKYLLSKKVDDTSKI